MDKLILKFIGHYKGPQRAKTSLKKNNKVVNLHFLISKLTLLQVTKTVQCWDMGRHIDAHLSVD